MNDRVHEIVVRQARPAHATVAIRDRRPRPAVPDGPRCVRMNGRKVRQAMKEPRKELLMQVDGMTCDGCVNAVTRTICRLDPSAEVDVDLKHGRVRVTTCAQALEVSQAIAKAGYEARAMTM